MHNSNETPFTCRMRQICDEAPQRCPGYDTAALRSMIDRCAGDFVPTAKKLLKGPIPSGLVRLAECGALDISMEAVVLQEQWRGSFDNDDLEAALRRLDEVRRNAAARAA